METQPVAATNQPAVKSEATEVREGERLRGGRVYRPLVDILDKADEIILQADVPGAQSDHIDVQFDDGELKLHARVEARHVPGTPMLEEYGVGDFYRTFRVSEQVDASRISAEYAHGVLTVHLPKIEAAKPRKISVKGT